MEAYDIEALVGLAALPIIITLGTSHVRLFVEAMRDWDGGTEWPLVADIIGTTFAVASWYAGYIPNDVVDSPLGAVLVGLAASLVTQKLYDATKRNEG